MVLFRIAHKCLDLCFINKCNKMNNCADFQYIPKVMQYTFSLLLLKINFKCLSIETDGFVSNRS